MTVELGLAPKSPETVFGWCIVAYDGESVSSGIISETAHIPWTNIENWTHSTCLDMNLKGFAPPLRLITMFLR